MSAALRAGTARSVITPPLGLPGTWRLRSGTPTDVHDEMLTDVLVLEGTSGPIVLVSLDLVAVDATFSDSVRSQASLATGIPPDAIIINASHNHSAPAWPLETAVDGTPMQRWGESVIDRVVACIVAAQHRTRAARMGVGYFKVPGLSTNRVWPDRPVDETAVVIRIDAEDGAPIMTITSFACHTLTVGGHTLEWTADFPGAIRRAIEARLPGSRSMFLQGAAGDIAPYDYWFGNPDPQPMGFAMMNQFGAEFADAALRTHRKIGTSAKADVDWTAADVSLQRRRLAWSEYDIQHVRAQIAPPLPDRLPEVWPAHLHTVNSAQHEPQYYQLAALDEFHAILQAGGAPVVAGLRAVRLGPLSILATPFELFSELGSTVASQSGAGPVVVLGYCDDYLGYFPPDGALAQIAGYSLADQLDQEMARWAYGITNTQIEDGQGRVFVDAGAALLRRVSGDGR